MSSAFQIYVYKVKDAAAAEAARGKAIAASMAHGGCLNWTPLSRTDPPNGDGTIFADVVEWASQEDCVAGTKQFQEDARVTSFREQIVELISGGDYQPV